uniref:Uncharacterized protein n=1 Tax=Trieres chinensis TaxID=1514140 RepID=A0A7S2EW77_TRICV|mmetsp:Transcript_7012/g.14715  ORF Transcript_7012/g.14715 Transcript_7012/m.14715 type:complete len:282 (+) Transcript_7012:29-874(+)
MRFLPVVLIVLIVSPTLALSGSGTAASPWAPAQWQITLDVGSNTAEGERDGPRLVLPLDLMVESESSSERDDFVGSGTSALRPLSLPTFVTTAGEQTVEVEGGGWRIELPPGGKGRASTLRFWLDFPNGADRNGATLPPGRSYFIAPCWRLNELELGRKTMAPFIAEAEEAQRRLDDVLSHETGDRRLDGTDVIDTVLAYGDMAKLVADRDEKRRRRKEAEQYLPSDANSLPQGHWPGTEEWLAIGKGSVVCKKRKLFGEELCLLGKFSAVSLALQSEKER